MKSGTTARVLVAGAAVLAAFGAGGTAQADAPGQVLQFRSQSGNIACEFTTAIGGKPGIFCDIADYTYTPPQRPDWCKDGNWGSSFFLAEGGAPAFGCQGQGISSAGLPILYYSHSTTSGNITCLSTAEGITCTDTSTGHYFRVARESYELH